MRRLSFLILFLVSCSFPVLSQSPHTNALTIDCSACHNPVNWNVDPAQIEFNHSTTGFTLLGQHLTADCKSCHSTLVFNEAASECISCHQDIHQNTVGMDCSKCHNSDSWLVKDINQIHEFSRFPLLGAHLTADCVQCHSNYQNLYFEPISVECFSCHIEDYNSTTSPNHIAAGFSTDCQDCHRITSTSWAADDFNHDFFPLVGGHKISDCFSCHQQGGNFTGLSTECYACHQEDYEQVPDPNHITGNFPTDCTQCHSINGWSPANFDHNLTQFPLTGAHVNQDCSSCHSETFSGTPTNCVECHQSDYNAALNPNHSAAGISTDCQTCHNTAAWVPSNFTHTLTGFELIGEHSNIDCSSCHQGSTAGLNQDCVSCHLDDYNASVNPNHSALVIPTECQTCHTPTPNWEPALFPIHNNYYELLGAHASIANDCATCHNGNYVSTPNTCFGCHEGDYNNTNNPPHASAGFSTDCETCHNQSAWVPSTFDHDNQYFPIYSGKHRGEWNTCSDCHTNPSNFSDFSCIDCHEHNQNDMDDEHQGVAGYIYESQACFACHPTGEEGNAFNHSLSDFPLTGAHTSLDCVQCHSTGYQGTSTVCYDCHQSNYISASNPNHQALSISTNCNECHSTEPGWEPALFPQHNQFFELTGRHAEIANDCFSCHSGNYNSTVSECIGCHQDNYNIAPNHTAFNYPTDCEMCHNTTLWSQVVFDHQATQFPLTGTHLNISCSSCHEQGFAGTPTDCFACHEDSYNNSLNPNHAAAGIPTDCESCHNTTAWIPSTFNHITTGFELLGQHATLQCSSCHEGTLPGLSQECISCHLDDYNIAPNHVAQGYPTNCEMCHNTTLWSQVVFDHQATQFPLTGTHLNISCSSCHEQGFAGTPTDCFACHEDSYNNSLNPNHAAAGIPTDCESCHNTTAWIPSTFNHALTGFELLGQHATLQCSSCHEGTLPGLSQECISCHLDDYNIAPNHVAQGYPTNCEMCHNAVAWSQVTFDHQVTNFPLTGAHINVNCSSCHESGFAGTTTVCFECHETAYNTSTNPNHVALAIPTDCETCHTTNPNWQPALFPIHNNYYQLLGAHAAIANNCVTCHNGDYNNTPNTCFGCHEPEYNATNDPPHLSLNFPVDCELCHTQSYWEPSTFDHDNLYFPIFSGKHKDEWNSCSDCHYDPTNYNIFSCIDCHFHNEIDMAEEHEDVPGYVYESWACYACHPDGSDSGIMPRLKRVY